MDIDNANVNSDKQSQETTTTAENINNLDNIDDDDTIVSSNKDGGHQEHEGVVKNRPINSNIDAENQDTVKGGTENSNLNIEVDNKSEDLEVIENKTNDIIEEEGVLGNNKDHEVGVIEIDNNDQQNAKNMIEIEIDAKEDKTSDPMTAVDSIQDNNVIILGSVLPSTEKTVKVRKRNNCKMELLALGITEFKEEEGNEFDVYADSDRIYKKYRLREAAKPDYRIPTSIDPTPTEEAKIKARRPSEEVFQCGKCNRRFFTNLELRSHHRLAHKLTYICSLCSQEFKSNKELVSHKKIHEEDKQPFICHECKLAFSDHCDFRLHELTHEKPNKIFKCPECGLKYNKRSYEVHIYTHFDTYKPCPICDKKVRPNRLTNHINSHSVRIECVECGKVMNDKKDYSSHMAIHTGVKPHQCLYCGKGFRLPQQKKVHTRIHTGEKLYACSVCDKRFIQQTDMIRHVERHHGTGKKECKICMKKVWDLTIHMRVHTAEKRFECSECGKKYLTVTGLKAHVVFTHSKERPFRCDYCDMGFANDRHLRRHELSKTHKRNLYKDSLKKEEN